MQHVGSESTPSRRFTEKPSLLGAVALFLCVAGCGTNNSGTAPATQKSGPPTYFAPYVFNTTNVTPTDLFPGPNTYLIDDAADTFSQSNFIIPHGPQIINAGVLLATSQRGLLNLGLTANYTPDLSTGGNYVATTYPETPGSFAVELANQAGGLVQIAGQPAAPLVAAQCPNLATALTYQFITIPGGLINSATSGSLPPFWDPTVNTAYGSVDITSDGMNVTFNNVHQYTLPSVGGTGVPANQAVSPVTGLCGPTVLGNTINTPGQTVTTNPGLNPNTPPQATVGIGPTGLLVEDNGSAAGASENVLGDGTGAVGLPKPASAVDVSTLTGAQYLGFVYGAGVFSGNVSSPSTGWSSHLASFGFSTTPSNCTSVATSSSTLIYGGDFPQKNGQDNPSASPNGYGNCDLAIDFGTQDASNNGLFPKATVWLGANYAANTSGQTYSFPAVAIAGQLNGKNAIFVLGVDSTQPWAIYLLQSN